jgi:hypothetical protein
LILKIDSLNYMWLIKFNETHIFCMLMEQKSICVLIDLNGWCILVGWKDTTRHNSYLMLSWVLIQLIHRLDNFNCFQLAPFASVISVSNCLLLSRVIKTQVGLFTSIISMLWIIFTKSLFFLKNCRVFLNQNDLSRGCICS